MMYTVYKSALRHDLQVHIGDDAPTPTPNLIRYSNYSNYSTYSLPCSDALHSGAPHSEASFTFLTLLFRLLFFVLFTIG